MKKSIFLLLMSSVLVLTACNTIQGLGEDIQDAGEAMEEAAK